MCDTLIALGGATADESVIFAKNSDREPNEAAEVISVPACDYPSGSTLHCTYIEIPQIEHTHRMLLAKPFWIWGAEMGVNEHGVVIGNEALFTRVPREAEPGLIGMDLLRLGLERAETARGALDVITGLLAEYGQGGNCGFAHPFFYNNSYLIGDRKEAWILETFGREWAAEQVDKFGAISNALTIGPEWDLASDQVVDYALEHGWAGRREGFDISKTYASSLLSFFGAGARRRSCSTGWLAEHEGQVTVAGVMQALRGHGRKTQAGWTPGSGIFSGVEVCMHAGYGPVRIDQTTNSMIVQLAPQGISAWVTASAAPCTGIYKPVWLDAGAPDGRPAPQ
jgi:secernin